MSHFTDYLWLVFAAWVGVIGRFGQWWDADKSFNWRKALGELLTVPAIGLIVGGGAQYFSPEMDWRIVGMLAALAGLLGTTAIQTIAMKWFEKRIG
jgi:hypothetical protein